MQSTRQQSLNLNHIFRFCSFLSPKSIFSGLEERFKDQLDAVRLQYPSEAVRVTEGPLVVHWEDGIQMLRDAGHEVCLCAREREKSFSLCICG